jgi:hypothetical protein
MLDPAALAKDVRSRLAPLEPLRRRVVRVYWMRGLLAAMLAAAATGLGLLAALASAVWALQATGGRDGEIVVRIVPVLLAFVAPLVLIVPAAGVALLAILRRYGRATVLEYDERFREEVIAPLVHEAVPDARLEPLGRVGDEQLRKSGLVPSGWEGTATGALLLHGGRPGAAFAVSTLDLRSRRRFGRAERVFRGLFASSERTASPPLADLERRRLGAPLRVLAYDGGVALALELPRAPFRASRVRPSDPEELARLVAFYAFVAESARSPATTSR